MCIYSRALAEHPPSRHRCICQSRGPQYYETLLTCQVNHTTIISPGHRVGSHVCETSCGEPCLCTTTSLRRSCLYMRVDMRPDRWCVRLHRRAHTWRGMDLQQSSACGDFRRLLSQHALRLPLACFTRDLGHRQHRSAGPRGENPCRVHCVVTHDEGP